MRRQRMQPIVAMKALKRLIRDPEQTHEVFTVIRALSGPALERGYRRFTRTRVGQKVLRERINLLDTLLNRDALRELPAGSLGREYLGFVSRENITADGLVEASEQDGEFKYLQGDIEIFAMRQRDMHDLWHTLTQYGRDELGEVCLLAFTYAQTKNRGVGLICLAGASKLRPFYGSRIFSAIWRAYRDGKNAAWLPGQDWEALLAQPIDEVRTQLGINVPVAYNDLYSQAQPA